MEKSAPLETSDSRVHREQLVIRVSQVPKVLLVLKVRRDQREPREVAECRE